MSNWSKRFGRQPTMGEYITVALGVAWIACSFIAAWQKSHYGQPSLITLAFIVALGCSTFVSFVVTRPSTPPKHRKKEK